MHAATRDCSGQPRTVEFKRSSVRARDHHGDHKTRDRIKRSSPESFEHGGAACGGALPAVGRISAFRWLAVVRDDAIHCNRIATAEWSCDQGGEARDRVTTANLGVAVNSSVATAEGEKKEDGAGSGF